MGAAQSIQPDPIPDPNIFINLGCVGLDANSFNNEQLSSAPFLSVNFQAGDYYSMINNIISTMKQIKPGWSPIPPKQNFNIDINSSDLNIKKDKKKSAKYSRENNNKINEDGSIKTTYSTPNGTIYPLYNGYNEYLDMQERLDTLSSLLTTSYANNTASGNGNSGNNYGRDSGGNSGNINDSVWAQQGGSLNGQTAEYWETKHVYGPVYFLAARDENTGQLDCYLYFPSMTKDSRLWPNFNFLGLAHNWMYLLLYGTGTRIQWCRVNDAFPGFWRSSSWAYGDGNKPHDGYPGSFNPCLNGYTRCKQTFGPMPHEDHYGWFGIYYGTSYFPENQLINNKWYGGQPMENRFMFGCKTKNPYNPYVCQQSTEAHQGMGIYDKNKSRDEYPVAYYHAYSLRFSDSRINSYINDGPNSLQYLTQSMYRGVSCGLAQSILPAYTKLLQGATNGLVSQNNKYFLVLSGYNLTLYINYYDLNLAMCSANNSFYGMGIAFNISFNKGGYNSYVVIEDNFINIYSSTNRVNTAYIVKSLPFIEKSESTEQYTLLLTNNGKLQVINLNNSVIGTLDPSKFSDSTYTNTPYNKNADYARRLLNLKLYLIFRNIYIEANIDPKNNKNNDTTSKEKQIIPTYNSRTNYMQRMIEFIKYLETYKRIGSNASEMFRESIIKQTKMDINGLIPDKTPNSNKNGQAQGQGQAQGLNDLNSQQNNQANNIQLPTGTTTMPSQKDTIKEIHTNYTNDLAAEQAAYNSKTNNEANANLQTCPKPKCIGPNCPPEKAKSEYIPTNSAKSLSALQEIAGTNSIFNNINGSTTDINNYGSDSMLSLSQKQLSKKQLYMAQRLKSLKSYFQIKYNILN